MVKRAMANTEYAFAGQGAKLVPAKTLQYTEHSPAYAAIGWYRLHRPALVWRWGVSVLYQVTFPSSVGSANEL